MYKCRISTVTLKYRPGEDDLDDPCGDYRRSRNRSIKAQLVTNDSDDNEQGMENLCKMQFTT